jgi:hypothetical protein
MNTAAQFARQHSRHELVRQCSLISAFTSVSANRPGKVCPPLLAVETRCAAVYYVSSTDDHADDTSTKQPALRFNTPSTSAPNHSNALQERPASAPSWCASQPSRQHKVWPVPGTDVESKRQPQPVEGWNSGQPFGPLPQVRGLAADSRHIRDHARRAI